jgi:hypothetical protein
MLQTVCRGVSLIEQLASQQVETRPMPFRIGLYQAIRRTALAQREAVRSDDLDRFYNLLQAREKLLEKAEAVDQELDAVDQTRAGGLVRDILRVDEETERLLVGKIDEARVELGDMAVGQQAIAAYGRSSQLVSITP